MCPDVTLDFFSVESQTARKEAYGLTCANQSRPTASITAQPLATRGPWLLAARQSALVPSVCKTGTIRRRRPQQFDPVTTPSAKGDNLTGERIGLQLGLHQSRQSVETTAHVSDAGGDPDTGSSRRSNHCNNCCRTSCSVCGPGAPVTRSLASPTSTAISK